MSDSPDGGLGNHGGMAELFNAWAVCEWHLNNLSRAEVLFDHALRLVGPGEEGSALRSYILYSIALLEYERGEYHLAQHCICLCLKENMMPGGNAKVWDLWARLAQGMGDRQLAQQCYKQSSISDRRGEASGSTRGSMMSALNDPDLSAVAKTDVRKMMRKDPWHYAIFDLEASEDADDSYFRGPALPESS